MTRTRMTRTRGAALAAAGLSLATLTALGACGECTGTPSCGNPPLVSYSGQFIEFRSGDPVGGVRVSFVKESGVDLVADSVGAVTDDHGHFTFRVGALIGGTVRGRVLVVPPPPHAPFTIPDVELATTTVRGDGGWLGRFVVNPYVLMVGIVRDRFTHERIPNATVIMRRTGGGRADEDTVSFKSDFGGQFSWQPAIVEPGIIQANFEIRAPGESRPHFVDRHIITSHKDGEIAFVILPVGHGLAYSGTTARRGSGEQVPGVVVEWRRTGGIPTQPANFSVSPDAFGTFPVPLTPQVDTGSVLGELRIIPPAPYPTEVHALALTVSDDDVVEWLGFLGYGAAIFLDVQLRFADDGQPLPAGTGVTLRRTGGVPLAWVNPPAQGDDRLADATGRLIYQAPAADSGIVTFDVIVRPPAPFAPDTLRGVNIPARYSDSAYVAAPLDIRRRLLP